VGTVQVVGTHPAGGHETGTAVMTAIFAPGPHAFTAVYGGTAQSPQRVESRHAKLKVNGATATNTLLVAAPNSGNPDNYDFTATVKGFGLDMPQAGADFFDITSQTDLGFSRFDMLKVSHGFDRPNVIPTLLGPAQSVVGDFNGDGYPDLATANASFTTGTVTVFLGNGNGQFKLFGTYATGIFTSGIVAGDFNNDGIPDIAAMSQGSNGGDGVV